MSSNDPRIRALQAAVERAPDDVELRSLLAAALLDAGLPADAEREYKAALRLSSGREDLTLGLVRALSAQGRQEAALSILDSFGELGDPSASLRIEHARLLLAAGREEAAAAQYVKAVTADPEMADPFLAHRLAVRGPSGAIAGGRERQAVGGGSGSGSDDAPLETERPKVTFRDVGGMESLKEEIRAKIIHPLRDPELYRAWGKPVGGGILLYGPPGCGKTHLARATAGEVDATFHSVGIHEVLEMWIGQSERNLHAIFEQARRDKPSVLFFDEVDALGAARADMRGAAGRHVINQFLAELDGIDARNDGLLVLAATNAPWHLDAAFRRPGRFDRVIFVPPPDLDARARVLEILCLGRPADRIDYEAIARKTERFSGADLKAVLDLAIEAKLSSAMRASGPAPPEPLRTQDLLASAKRVKPTTTEWFQTARNYVLYANQGGLYDDVRAYLDIQ